MSIHLFFNIITAFVTVELGLLAISEFFSACKI